MYDTLHFKILNFSKYEKIKQYSTKRNLDKTSVVSLEGNEDSIKIAPIFGTLFHSNNKIRINTGSNIIYSPSSHYHTNINFRYSDDTALISISIPKYIFGTNVFQFIDSDPRQTLNNRILDVQYLRSFFRYFFKSIFQMSEIPQISIRRIDLCYNQIFQDELSAKLYLKELRDRFKNNFNSSKVNIYNLTGVQYVTKRFSFKAYHKGTEFQKHDYRELIKSDLKYNYSFTEISELANRIVRYEITARHSYLKWLNAKLFEAEYIDIIDEQINPFHKNFNLLYKVLHQKFRKMLELVQPNQQLIDPLKIRERLHYLKYHTLTLKGNIAPIISFYILQQNYTDKEILEMQIYSKSAFYRLKNKCKDLGLYRPDSYQVAVPELTFRTYFSILNLSHKYYFNNITKYT